jgi:hypothetical protein
MGDRISNWPNGPDYLAQVEGIRNAVPDAWVRNAVPDAWVRECPRMVACENSRGPSGRAGMGGID